MTYVLRPTLLADARLMADYMAGVMSAAAAPDWPTCRQRMPVKLAQEAMTRWG